MWNPDLKDKCILKYTYGGEGREYNCNSGSVQGTMGRQEEEKTMIEKE
jgi:hypothetical protein